LETENEETRVGRVACSEIESGPIRAPRRSLSRGLGAVPELLKQVLAAVLRDNAPGKQRLLHTPLEEGARSRSDFLLPRCARVLRRAVAAAHGAPYTDA
jgi:hypothetical protein